MSSLVDAGISTPSEPYMVPNWGKTNVTSTTITTTVTTEVITGYISAFLVSLVVVTSFSI